MSKDAFHSVFDPTVRAFMSEAFSFVARPLVKWGGVTAIFLSVSGDAGVSHAAQKQHDGVNPVQEKQHIKTCPDQRPDLSDLKAYMA